MMKTFEITVMVFLCFTVGSSITWAANCPTIVSRAQWGAKAAKGRTSLSTPLSYAVIHHTDTPSCNSQTTCAARVRSIQNHHMTTNGWDDIGYNFLVGEDGMVYEGRGWRNVGAHSPDWNSKSYGIAVIGTYQSVLPNSLALNAVKALLACAQPSYLKTSYTLYGHRDTRSTTCPGDRLYAEIKTWPRYPKSG